MQQSSRAQPQFIATLDIWDSTVHSGYKMPEHGLPRQGGDSPSRTTDVLWGTTKVKIAFLEVDPVTKAGTDDDSDNVSRFFNVPGHRPEAVHGAHAAAPLPAHHGPHRPGEL